MLDEIVNEQLGLLENELLRLKSITDSIERAKENSDNIIDELEKIQNNFATYTQKVFERCINYAGEMKTNAELQINDAILQVETIGNKIDTTYKENLIEIKRHLSQYKNLAEATDKLVKSLAVIDFPMRLTSLDKSVETLGDALNERAESIEAKQKISFKALSATLREKTETIESVLEGNFASISENLVAQNKQIIFLNKVLMGITIFLLIGFLTIIFLCKN